MSAEDAGYDFIYNYSDKEVKELYDYRIHYAKKCLKESELETRRSIPIVLESECEIKIHGISMEGEKIVCRYEYGHSEQLMPVLKHFYEIFREYGCVSESVFKPMPIQLYETVISQELI